MSRAEGLAFGFGTTVRVAGTATMRATARYGLGDQQSKATVALGLPLPWGERLELFGGRDYRDAGDVAERAGVTNSLATQEFGSDFTQPVDVRRAGARLTLGTWGGIQWSAEGASEQHRPVRIAYTPVQGHVAPTLPAIRADGVRASLVGASAPWRFATGGILTVRSEMRGVWLDTPDGPRDGWRAMFDAEARLPLGSTALMLRTVAGAATGDARTLPQQRVLFGGPVSGPGYGYHTFAGTAAVSQRVEWRTDVPFVPLPLARFGRVPGRATLAPYVHAVWVDGQAPFAPPRQGWYPSAGIGAELFMGLLRVDVARGLRGGGWMFGVDVGRVFWSIL